MNFKENRYAVVSEVIPVDICKIATKYALIKEQCFFEPENGNDAQVPGAHSTYADTLMETLLHFLKPHMKKITGLDLCPTYSYFRVYRPGNELKRHKDRPSCEISTTACFGFKYNDVQEDYSWDIFVDKDSYKVSLEDNGTFVSNNQSGVAVKQGPGDLMVYRGCEIEHWRPVFEAGTGSYQVQAFFHYIDKNGPYYPEFAYDRRPYLGYQDTLKMNK